MAQIYATRCPNQAYKLGHGFYVEVTLEGVLTPGFGCVEIDKLTADLELLGGTCIIGKT